MNRPLLEIVKAQKSGRLAGLYSICSANRFVIEASMLQAKADNSVLCIEATSNQVDQFGGYTGMNPAQFAAYVKKVAKAMNFPFEKVILGGDHLGPNSWKGEKEESAMAKSVELVKAYVTAGFKKIHLDPSMALKDDNGSAPAPEVIAKRAAVLAEACETVNQECEYIVGTEVPTPGGAVTAHEEISVTSVADVSATVKMMKDAFKKRKLAQAWQRVHGIVVQPGVEFGDVTVDCYNAKKSEGLKRHMEKCPNLVYEAHSTDYQSAAHLKELVRDHFAILKVGPWLTFAFREALFLLEAMEKVLLKKGGKASELEKTLETVMLASPKYWEKYYKGTKEEIAFKRKYSYSDRCRYYWPDKKLDAALKLLISNLSQKEIPLTLLSQYMPNQYMAVSEGRIKNTPEALIHSKIMEVTSMYAEACGMKT